MSGPPASWTLADMLPQTGRRVVITGATGGIGYETALALAAAGARVTLTGRHAAKGRAAIAAILDVHPTASVGYADFDLAELASVNAFAERFSKEVGGLDILVNNAGVMTPPTRHVTKDGFELQFETNYLGHFALTSALMPLFSPTGSRVVNLSSGAHKIGADIHFDDLQWTRIYKPWQAYAQSKLAMLMFTFELQRRSDAAGWGLQAVAVHPGWARTGLQSAGPGMGRKGPSFVQRLGSLIEPLFSQSSREGALPSLFAATSSLAKPGGYYGPQGTMEMKGPVGEAKIGKRALDRSVWSRLWSVSNRLTEASWPE